MSIQDKVNDILVELTNITGFEQNDRTLNAFFKAKEDISKLIEQELKTCKKCYHDLSNHRKVFCTDCSGVGAFACREDSRYE